MKLCKECGEEIAAKFTSCPKDGTPLNSLARAMTSQHLSADFAEPVKAFSAPGKPELQLTIIDTNNLLQRLVEEIGFVGREVKASWPKVRHDPIGYGKSILQDGWKILAHSVHTPTVLAGAVSAALLAISALIIGLRLASNPIKPAGPDSATEIVMLDVAGPLNPSFDKGIGVGGKGRVGFRIGTGEGSKPEPKRSRGGGGGGFGHLLDVQSGRIPEYSDIPAPIAKPPTPKNRTLPVAGIDLDPLLWERQPLPNFGDPRALVTASSNGPGTGGGIGNNNGTGIGEGSGPGFGPGTNGNIGGGQNERGGGEQGGSRGNSSMDGSNRVMRINEVTQRVRVLSKPEPQYTEDARRNQIVGTVVLRVIFTRSGEVTNIRVVQPLQFGLTERAIAAARQIRFLPAIKDQHSVSVYMQLEYNFNLY
ncbi:MAG TPA: energy transducer TonB [Pyrinomonadaceae bacterium]|nr:energy transducer TonB [Pyrinomonadaceae bacterium]